MPSPRSLEIIVAELVKAVDKLQRDFQIYSAMRENEMDVMTLPKKDDIWRKHDSTLHKILGKGFDENGYPVVIYEREINNAPIHLIHSCRLDKFLQVITVDGEQEVPRFTLFKGAER